LTGRRLRAGCFRNGTVGVVGGAGCAEPESRRVALAHRLNVIRQARRSAHAHHQDTRCQWVECAGVPDFRFAREPPLNAVHHVAGGHPAGFVDDEEAVHSETARGASGPPYAFGLSPVMMDTVTMSRRSRPPTRFQNASPSALSAFTHKLIFSIPS